ncbi:MAG TPA: hypothetical protein VHC96_17560 [Puia sp.]|nr:hypothetical protein [Puia sp.]
MPPRTRAWHYHYPSLARIILPVSRPLVIVVIACGLLASYNYKEAWKNFFSGCFYHSLQKDRRLFPHGASVTLRRWLEERPTLLYFDNEAEDNAGKYLLQILRAGQHFGATSGC